MLKRICKPALPPDVTVSWTIKDDMSLFCSERHTLCDLSNCTSQCVKQIRQACSKKQKLSLLVQRSLIRRHIAYYNTGKGLHMFLSRVLQADSCKDPKLRSFTFARVSTTTEPGRVWCSTSSDQETTQQRLGDQIAASEVERRLVLDDHSCQTLHCESKAVLSQCFAAW